MVLLVSCANLHQVRIHTPWFHVECDHRLGRWLGLASLLGSVLSQTLFSDLGCLCILFLVIRAEQVDILIIILLLLWGLGGNWQLRDLWAVGGVLL